MDGVIASVSWVILQLFGRAVIVMSTMLLVLMVTYAHTKAALQANSTWLHLFWAILRGVNQEFSHIHTGVHVSVSQLMDELVVVSQSHSLRIALMLQYSITVQTLLFAAVTGEF